MTDHAISEFLRKRGCAVHVINSGIDGLLNSWKHLVESLERKEDRDFDDYLNDLDARQIIHELQSESPTLKSATLKSLSALDARFRAVARPVKRCVWGTNVAKRNRWDAKTHWWYFAIPRTS